MPSGPTDERPSRAFKATKAFAREARAVGLRVRTIRQERGWTLEQASERMQLELRHLQKIEAGEINVTLATFMRIAEGLREPLPMLFNNVAEPRTSYAPAGSAKGEDARRPEPQRTGSGNPKWGTATFPGSPREADLVIRDVGTRLAEFRGMRGLTQVALAESAGVALKYIQRVEAGGQNLTLRSLVRLAQGLGIDAIELLTKPSAPLNRETKKKRQARAPAKKRP